MQLGRQTKQWQSYLIPSIHNTLQAQDLKNDRNFSFTGEDCQASQSYPGEQLSGRTEYTGQEETHSGC